MAPKQQSKLKKVVRKRKERNHRYAGQRPVLGLLRRPGLPRQQEVYSFCCTDRR